LTSIDPDGGGVTAWPATSPAGLPVVDVLQNLPGGALQSGQLAAPLSGVVTDLSLGGSGLGDALVAFQQGPASQPQVMGAVAQAPPAEFLISTPLGWVTSPTAALNWDPASEAVGAPTYSVIVDGIPRATGLAAQQVALNLAGLSDGKHEVQVMAVDTTGQRVVSREADLDIDHEPPVARVAGLRGRIVRVIVKDAGVGAVARPTVIAFGDGTVVRHRLTVRHVYRQAGTYVIRVASADSLGHRGVQYLRVRAR
jgi:hypothetical protein